MHKPNTQGYPLGHKWDFRTGSPHKVFRAIQDVVEELGYTIILNEPLELKPSPITDVATFKAEVKGEMQMTARCNWKQALVGIPCIIVAVLFTLQGWDEIAFDLVVGLILLFIGFGLFILGIALVATAWEKRKRMLQVKMEGEVYRASARVVEWAETVDVVADTRVVVSASIASLAGGTEIKAKKVKDADRRILEEDFGKLMRRIEVILPSFVLHSP